jgi:hypothetical protein
VQLGVYDLLQQGARLSDKFLVSFLVAPALSAIYFNGAQEVPFLSLLLGAAGGALVQQAAVGTRDDVTETVTTARVAGQLLSNAVFPLFWWLLLFREELFEVVFSTRYAESATIFAASLLILPLRAYPFTSLLQHYRRGDLINLGALLDLILALLLAPLLYMLFGLPGVALSFSIATLGLAVFYLYHTSRISGVRIVDLIPVRNWIIKLAGSGVVFIGIRYIAMGWQQMGFRLFLGAAAAGLLASLTFWADLRKTPVKYGKKL